MNYKTKGKQNPNCRSMQLLGKIGKKEFDCITLANDYVFVIVHSDKCGHCINLLKSMYIPLEDYYMNNVISLEGTDRENISIYVIPSHKLDSSLSNSFEYFPTIILYSHGDKESDFMRSAGLKVNLDDLEFTCTRDHFIRLCQTKLADYGIKVFTKEKHHSS